MGLLTELRALPRPLWVLYAATTLLRIGAFVYPYLTIYLTRELGFTTGDAGWILAAGGCGLVLGNLVGGQLTDRFARKGTLLLALAINASGYLGLLLMHDGGGSDSALWLGVAYVGMGMFSPTAQTIVADLCRPEQRTLAYTGFYLSGNLGIAFGPLIGGFLAAYSFTCVFVGDVVTTAACATLVIVGLPRTAHAKVSEAKPTPSIRGVYRRAPRVTLFCVATFFVTAPLMGLEYAVPLLVERTFGAPLHWVGVVYTVNAVTILGSSFLLERAVRHRAELPFMMAAAGLWAIGLAWLCAGWSVAALVLSTAVWTLGEVLASILVPSYVAARVGAGVKGRFLALGDLGRSVATVLSPIVLGQIWMQSGPAAVSRAILALPIVGAAAFGLLWLSARRAPRILRSEPAG